MKKYSNSIQGVRTDASSVEQQILQGARHNLALALPAPNSPADNWHAESEPVPDAAMLASELIIIEEVQRLLESVQIDVGKRMQRLNGDQVCVIISSSPASSVAEDEFNISIGIVLCQAGLRFPGALVYLEAELPRQAVYYGQVSSAGSGLFRSVAKGAYRIHVLPLRTGTLGETDELRKLLRVAKQDLVLQHVQLPCTPDIETDRTIYAYSANGNVQTALRYTKSGWKLDIKVMSQAGFCSVSAFAWSAEVSPGEWLEPQLHIFPLIWSELEQAALQHMLLARDVQHQKMAIWLPIHPWGGQWLDHVPRQAEYSLNQATESELDGWIHLLESDYSFSSRTRTVIEFVIEKRRQTNGLSNAVPGFSVGMGQPEANTPEFDREVCLGLERYLRLVQEQMQTMPGYCSPSLNFVSITPKFEWIHLHPMEDRAPEDREVICLDQVDRAEGSKHVSTVKFIDIMNESNTITAKLSDVIGLCLIGESGCGKTWLLKQEAFKYAFGLLSGLQRAGARVVPDQGKVPMFLQLSTVADVFADHHPDVFDAVLRALEREYPLTPTLRVWLREQLKKGRGVVLLDGFDEVSYDQRASVVHIIRRLIENKCQVIVSMRSSNEPLIEYVTREAKLSGILRTCGLDRRQIRRFLMAWFDQSSEQGKLLYTEIINNPDVLVMARRPMTLMLICRVYAINRSLPTTRVELFEQGVRIILGRSHHLDDTYASEVDAKYKLLGEIAQMNGKRDGSNQSRLSWVLPEGDRKQESSFDLRDARIENSELYVRQDRLSALENLVGNRKRFMVELCGSDGILAMSADPPGVADRRYHFTHKSFQEYLIARMVSQTLDIDVNDEVTQLNFDPSCHDMLAMLAGCLTNPNLLLSRIMRYADDAEEESSGLFVLAGRCLAEIKPERLERCWITAITNGLVCVVHDRNSLIYRRSAARLLLRQGRNALAALLATLVDAERDVRAIVKRVAVDMHEDVLHCLSLVSMDADWRVRWGAIWLAGQLPLRTEGAAVSVLLNGCRDPNQDVRAQAQTLVYDCGGEQARARLRDLDDIEKRLKRILTVDAPRMEQDEGESNAHSPITNIRARLMHLARTYLDRR